MEAWVLPCEPKKKRTLTYHLRQALDGFYHQRKSMQSPCSLNSPQSKEKKKRNNHIWSLDTQKKSTLLIFQSPRAYKTPCKLAQTTKVNEKKSTFSSTPAGRMMGRNERECGQTGVTKIAATLGWTIEAPAATAYAVLPVGVEMIRPGMHTTSKRHITLQLAF